MDKNMMTFTEFLYMKRDLIEENWLSKTVGGLALAGSLAGGGDYASASPVNNLPARMQSSVQKVSDSKPIQVKIPGPRQVTAQVTIGEKKGEVSFLASKLDTGASIGSNATRFAQISILKALGVNQGKIKGFQITEIKKDGNRNIVQFEWASVE